MVSFTPVSLSGDSLSQRHQQLNSLVQEAHDKGISKNLEILCEQTPVDRLLKIDLANKNKNVDYIINNNLKSNDLLYVSRALKSTWLLQNTDIINPKYLEEVLFPEMVAQAVTKMKHWLYMNLCEPSMCQEFYLFYKEKKFEFAVKFLNHCSDEFILSEVPKILIKLSPHYVKILCEKCPKVAKIYFDSMALDEKLTAHYLEHEQSYYNSVKCVLKMDGEVFLDITEKYFNMNRFSRLSASQTDYIMRNHKDRFMSKLELYIAYLLHIPTVARRLSVEECQEAVVRSAKATYVQHWFEYKTVEPFIKRLNPDSRAAFKKRVFVEKDIGECVEQWPYDIPITLTYADSDSNVFDDPDSTGDCEMFFGAECLKKRKYCAYSSCVADCVLPMKSELQRLFDEFRYAGFERVLHELAPRLSSAGSADRRRDMFLVLVSKSGGRSEAVSELLRVAIRHNNEPPHTRAAVLRSLVKRAQVWRLPAGDWQHLLEFGHGLGLDGTRADAACREGLHAVVIRQLLAGECEPAVMNAFLNDFSTLAEYSLNLEERARIASNLPNLLLEYAKHAEPELAVKHFDKVFDVLKMYKVHVEPTSPTVEAVMSLASRDVQVARPLLERLYNEKIARRELFRMNLKFRRDEAMFLNALRHDPQALDLEQIVEVLASSDARSFDRFISKLAIYFGQKEDYGPKLRSALKDKFVREKNVKLIRPYAGLVGQDIDIEIQNLDLGDKEHFQLSVALRACAHRARSDFNVLDWTWRKAGVKAVATSAMCCREALRDSLTRYLANERRTIRLALALSMRSESDTLLDTFRVAVSMRRPAALRAAIIYFRQYGDKAGLRVWDIVKPLLTSINLSRRKTLRRLLANIDWIPSVIKPDYCATLYPVMDKIAKSSARSILRELVKLLPKVSDELLENVLLWILESSEKEVHHVSIFIRYLMLSKNYEDLKRRFDKIGNGFMEKLYSMRGSEDPNFNMLLNQTMESLKYNGAFFDTNCTCCLTVIEKFLDWMQKFMPKEKYFKEYASVHLTMLYYKAIRQCMKQMPEVFADEKRKKSEGAEAVGFIFGKYIAREVAELVRTYFDSVIELYSDALDDYLQNYFMYGSSTGKFVGAVIKGILSESEGHNRRMAVYTFDKKRYTVEDSTRHEIEDLMMKDKSLAIFVYGVA